MSTTVSLVSRPIIYQILKKIHEPLKIIKLQLVSKEWKEECEKLFPLIDWKKYCLENINKFSLYSIIMSMSLKVQVKNHQLISDQKIWKEIFDSYVIWQSIENHKLHIVSTTNRWTAPFFNSDEIITCCDAWSTYFAIGTNEGRIFIFSNYDFLKPHHIIPSMRKSVKNIKFWYTEFGKLLLIRKYNNRANHYLKFWDVGRGTELTTMEQNVAAENFCIGSAHCFYGRAALIFFKCSPSSPAYKEMITPTYFLSLSDDQDIKAMNSFEMTAYMLICDKSSMKLFVIKDVDYKKQNKFEFPVPRQVPKLPEKITDQTLFYVLLDKTIIYIGDRMLHFLTNNSEDWTSISMNETFKGKIQTLVTHTNLLCLGVEGGNLYMYSMTSPNELQSSEFFQRSVPRIIHLKSEEPFISLKITHVSGNPAIIVATEKTLWGICTAPLNTEVREFDRSEKLEYYYY